MIYFYILKGSQIRDRYFRGQKTVTYLTTFIQKEICSIYMDNVFLHLWDEYEQLLHTTHTGTFHFPFRV